MSTTTKNARSDARRLSSRLQAHLLSRTLLAGEPPSKRFLILEMDGDTCTCVYSAGSQALAVWRLDVGALHALCCGILVGEAREAALGRIHDEATRMLEGSRLTAVRASIDKVLVVHARPTPLGRILAAVLLEALFVGEGATPPVVESTEYAEYAPRVSARAAGESRSVSSAR